MRCNIRKNQDGANFIVSVVGILGVMIAVIVGAIVFFAFADAGQDITNQSEDFTIVDVTSPENYNVSIQPDTSTPDWGITANNNATELVASQYNISGQWVQIDSNVWGAGNTTATITFNARSYSSVGDVITYAIIVFTMLAIIPLIVIGGLMLSSLGFFGKGSGKP